MGQAIFRRPLKFASSLSNLTIMKRFRNLALAALSALAVAGSAITASAIDKPIVIGNARFTFITDNLVRLEYAENAKFLNDSTLFAVDRTPREVDVKMEQNGNKYTFTTPAFTLNYEDDGCPFGLMNLSANWQQNGEEKKWRIPDRNNGNLKGQVSTPMALDEVYKPVPLLDGLLSRDGWYLINDTGKDVYKDNSLTYRDRGHVQDLYLFVYGNDYKAAMKSLQAISGPVPMPRKYVHGAWYCRWWRYSADDYREIVKGYKEHDFPIDIMVFDMDWHRKDGKIGTGHAGTRGWTGYSFNKELIPDPEGLLSEFRKDNIYVTLNDHPHDGIRDTEDCWEGFIAELGTDPAKDGHPYFDAGNPKYMKAFFNHAHRPSENAGVAFWWLDWQQDYAFPVVRGTTTKHLPWLNELYYNDSRQNNLRGQGFSRWGGWGDHRHPIQFTGDIYSSWETLDFEVLMTITSGNMGSFFCAHDIGGFYNRGTPELYTRWTQYGLLNAALRIHSCWGEGMDRRPWMWGERFENAMRDAYHLRSKLFPYIYSSVRQCNTDMLPLLRGLYYDHPDTEESYKRPTLFMFGDLILGAPVTEAGQGDDFVVNKEVYFPEGSEWYSLFNHKRYDGGSTVKIDVPLEESPVFVKGGYPLPMQPYTPRMASTPLETLVVRCYPGTNGSYTLYEDDGITEGYKNGEFATTAMSYDRADDGTVTVIINGAEGTYDGQPMKRACRLELPGVSHKAKVKAEGRKCKVTRTDEFNGITIDLPAADVRRPVKVTIKE